MKNQLPFCPYCKSRMSYLQAWGIHKDGEYRCPRCGKASNIRYTKRLRTFAAAASALGFLIAVLLVIFRQGIQFGHVLLIIVPFLFFFLLAPFTIVLSPMKGHRKKHVRGAKPAGSFHRELSGRRAAGAFSEERPVSEEKTDPYREKFYDPDPPGKNAGDSLEISSASHSGYYSSKYDFSLFEETRRIDKVKNNPSVSKRRQAQRPAKRRVDPLKKPGGTEEDIDQSLQDFIDE